MLCVVLCQVIYVKRNSQICRLMFSGHDNPRDALNQFQKHIELFKDEKGTQELMFEHHNWIAQQ